MGKKKKKELDLDALEAAMDEELDDLDDDDLDDSLEDDDDDDDENGDEDDDDDEDEDDFEEMDKDALIAFAKKNKIKIVLFSKFIKQFK